MNTTLGVKNSSGLVAVYNGSSNNFNNWDSFFAAIEVKKGQSSTFDLAFGGEYDNSYDKLFKIIQYPFTNYCTLLRYNYPTGSYVEVLSNSSVIEAFNRLQYIYLNGTRDHKDAIAAMNIDTAFLG